MDIFISWFLAGAASFPVFLLFLGYVAFMICYLDKGFED